VRWKAQKKYLGSWMSLWDVDDRATSRLMENFHNFLSQGLSVGESIRQAKLQYIEASDDSRFANPYYWAAFVPLGDSKPVVIKKSNYLLYLLLIVPVAIVFAIRRKRKKQQ